MRTVNHAFVCAVCLRHGQDTKKRPRPTSGAGKPKDETRHFAGADLDPDAVRPLTPAQETGRERCSEVREPAEIRPAASGESRGCVPPRVYPAGTQKACQRFLPHGEAQVFARSLGLASSTEWRAWCKAGNRPSDVPAGPDRAYKGAGWQGWGPWLGTGNAQLGVAKPFLLYEKAQAFARSLGLASKVAWQAWCKAGNRPLDVPSTPDRAYKGTGWQGWGAWLGTGNQRSKEFLLYDEAQAFARSLGWTNQTEWYAWCRKGSRPPNVPSRPDQTYKNGGWQGWGHWLGHASPDSATPAHARLASKRTSADATVGAAGKSGSKRRRH